MDGKVIDIDKIKNLRVKTTVDKIFKQFRQEYGFRLERDLFWNPAGSSLIEDFRKKHSFDDEALEVFFTSAVLDGSVRNFVSRRN